MKNLNNVLSNFKLRESADDLYNASSVLRNQLIKEANTSLATLSGRSNPASEREPALLALTKALSAYFEAVKLISPEIDDILDQTTNAFLRWPLPDSVCADLCASTQGPGRVGTNLLSYTEAKKMLKDIALPIIINFAKDRIDALEHENTAAWTVNENLLDRVVAAEAKLAAAQK